MTPWCRNVGRFVRRASSGAVLLVALAACTGAPGTASAKASKAESSVSDSADALTAPDLLSAPVPAACNHAAGNLVDGTLPGLPQSQGAMGLAGLNQGTAEEKSLTALGDLAGNGPVDAATILSCNAGGVPWPQIIAFYSPGPGSPAEPENTKSTETSGKAKSQPIWHPSSRPKIIRHDN